MLSPADSIIVFIFVLVIILVIFFSVIFIRSARSNAHSSTDDHVQSGGSIRVEQPEVAKRLDPSTPAAQSSDPRGVDIGGNYSK